MFLRAHPSISPGPAVWGTPCDSPRAVKHGPEPMWPTALIGAGALLTGLFVAGPLLGESVLPLADAVLYLRLLAALIVSAALVVWDVRRRHALAKIAELHGIRVAEVPSRATGILGSL